MWPLPKMTVKITRNISGKMSVKNSDAGFRMKALLMYQICLMASATELIPAIPGHRR